jgi:hypothetical protein
MNHQDILWNAISEKKISEREALEQLIEIADDNDLLEEFLSDNELLPPECPHNGLEYTVPEWAVCFLECGDATDLTEHEVELCEIFKTELEENKSMFKNANGYVFSWQNDFRYERGNDVGGGGANCCTVWAIYI